MVLTIPPQQRYRDGASIPDLYPAIPAVVLAALAQASGVPTPDVLSFYNPQIDPANTPIPVLSQNLRRSFLAIFNVNVAPIQFTWGTEITLGDIKNFVVGPGQAWFWANAQGLLPVPQGPLVAISQLGIIRLWLWEDGSNLYNNGGVLAFADAPIGWPTSMDGLNPGDLWNNGLEPAIVVPLVIGPDPSAPPVFFGAITAQDLLALSGRDLPISDPHVVNQLWNDGGAVAISAG